MDTVIPEPSLTAGEVEMLLFALDRARMTFGWKCGGLDAAGLNKQLAPSTMTLGGLLKHLALVEDHYTCRRLADRPINAPWDAIDWDADPNWEWRTAAEDSPEQLYALWEGSVARAREHLADLLAHGGLDQAVTAVNEAGDAPNLRRMLVDLHEEYARHTGHADLLREAVDGLVGEDPPRS